MAKPPAPHPIFSTRRLRLRQFRAEDVDAMHLCFANPEAMRFWNQPVHMQRIQTERAVRNFIDCTPSYYRFWAVADAGTDRWLGLVNYHDGHIRSKRVAIGYIIDPARHRQGIATEAISAMLDFCFGELACTVCKPSFIPTTSRRVRWWKNSGSAAKACCATTCAWAIFGATICSMPFSKATVAARIDFTLARLGGRVACRQGNAAPFARLFHAVAGAGLVLAAPTGFAPCEYTRYWRRRENVHACLGA